MVQEVTEAALPPCRTKSCFSFLRSWPRSLLWDGSSAGRSPTSGCANPPHCPPMEAEIRGLRLPPPDSLHPPGGAHAAISACSLPLPPQAGSPPDLLLERGLEQLEQQVGLAAGGGVVVQAEDDGLHEPGGLALRRVEDQPGQVGRLSLQATGTGTAYEAPRGLAIE